MVNKQPEARATVVALRLADDLENYGEFQSYFDGVAAELRRLHAENEALQKALRRVVRAYMVADDAWDHDADLERLYQREMKT